jgi:hypothetical protein
MVPRLARPASTNGALPAWPTRNDPECDSSPLDNDSVIRMGSSPRDRPSTNDEGLRSWLCLCPTACCTAQPSKRDRVAFSGGNESAEASYLSKAQKVARSGSSDAGPSSSHSQASSSLHSRLCSKPLHAYIVGGEFHGNVRRRLQLSPSLLHFDSWAELPSRWREQQTSVVEPVSRGTGRTRTRYDKAFCVEWIGDDVMAISTKCGHILQLNRRTRQLKEVELEGARCALFLSMGDADVDVDKRCSISCNALSRLPPCHLATLPQCPIGIYATQPQ